MNCLELPTISFCEGVYRGGKWGVWEFWNAFSSLFFVAVALRHLWYLGNDTELTPILMQTLLVGIGSTLFHSIPMRFYQMMDELPMILLITSSIRLIHSHMFLYKRYNRRLYYFLSIAIETMVVLVIIFNVFSDYFLVFELLYIMMIMIYVGIVLWANWVHKMEVLKVIGVGIFSFIFWLIDQHLCNSFLGSFSMHFFWHMGMSIVIYNFVEFYKIMKLEHNNKRVIIKRWGPFFTFETNGYIEFEDEL